MPNSILVTGGAGFVGSHLAKSLLADGYHVEIVDNLSTGKLENVSDSARSNRKEAPDDTRIPTCRNQQGPASGYPGHT